MPLHLTPKAAHETSRDRFYVRAYGDRFRRKLAWLPRADGAGGLRRDEPARRMECDEERRLAGGGGGGGVVVADRLGGSGVPHDGDESGDVVPCGLSRRGVG